MNITIPDGATNFDVLNIIFPGLSYIGGMLGCAMYENDKANIVAERSWYEAPFKLQEDSK